MKNLATKNSTDFTVLEDGQAFISQPKLASLINIPVGTLTSFISRSKEISNTINGLDANSLEIAVAHYAMTSRSTTVEAQALYRTLAQAGAKAYIYHQAGYVFEAKKPEVLPAALPIPSPTELAQMVIKAEEEKAALMQQIDNLQIAGLSVVSEIGPDLYFNVAAKILSTNLGIDLGHNTLMELLRANGYLLMGTRSIYEKNMPSQKYIHFFRVIIHRNDHTGAMCHATVIRPEGLAHIAPLVSRWLYDHTNLKRLTNGLVPLPPPPHLDN